MIGSVTSEDSLVNWTSNLAAASVGPPGETAAQRLVRESKEIIAGTRAGYSEDGTEDEPVASGRLIGAIACSVLGAAVIPEYFLRPGEPPGNMHVALAGILGGVLGYYFPLPTTVLYSAMLVKQSF